MVRMTCPDCGYETDIKQPNLVNSRFLFKCPKCGALNYGTVDFVKSNKFGQLMIKWHKRIGRRIKQDLSEPDYQIYVPINGVGFMFVFFFTETQIDKANIMLVWDEFNNVKILTATSKNYLVALAERLIKYAETEDFRFLEMFIEYLPDSLVQFIISGVEENDDEV